MKNLAPEGLVSLAIAEGATSPTPTAGVGTLLWSSTTLCNMRWDGTMWRSLKPLLSATMIAQALASNIATDVAAVSLVVPANALAIGSSFAFQLYGSTDNGTTPGTLTVWTKIGATKITSQAFTTSTTAGTLKQFWAQGTFTFRTLGATGSVIGGMIVSSASSSVSTNSVIANVNGSTSTAATNAALTLAIGFTWTAANVSNIARADIGFISQVN